MPLVKGSETMGSNVEYYIAKGFDQKMAEYFAAGRRKITKVVPKDNYTLMLTFDNGECRVYDMAPLVQSDTVFAHFRKLEDFFRVYLDDNNCVSWDIDPSLDSNNVWNNKVDLCPDSCYVNSIPAKGANN